MATPPVAGFPPHQAKSGLAGDPGEAPSAAAAGESEQVKQIAEEIRFYLDQSLLREAEFAIQKLAELDPSNLRLPDFHDQLAAKRAAQAAPQQAPTGAPETAQASRGQEPEFAARRAHDINKPPPASTENNLDQFVGDLERSLGIDFPFKPSPAPGVAPATARASAADKPPSTPPPASYTEPARAVGAAAPIPERQAPAAPVAGSEASSLSDVFREFKAEMEVGTTKEDPEVHYNLGLAFEDMGLLDEAIGEFQLVCQSIDQGQPFPDVLQAYTWLAQCLVAKGAPRGFIQVVSTRPAGRYRRRGAHRHPLRTGRSLRGRRA